MDFFCLITTIDKHQPTTVISNEITAGFANPISTVSCCGYRIQFEMILTDSLLRCSYVVVLSNASRFRCKTNASDSKFTEIKKQHSTNNNKRFEKALTHQLKQT